MWRHTLLSFKLVAVLVLDQAGRHTLYALSSCLKKHKISHKLSISDCTLHRLAGAVPGYITELMLRSRKAPKIRFDIIFACPICSNFSFTHVLFAQTCPLVRSWACGVEGVYRKSLCSQPEVGINVSAPSRS